MGRSAEPAFLLLAFYDNPASQTSVTSIPSIIFVPNTASLAKILIACAAVKPSGRIDAQDGKEQKLR